MSIIIGAGITLGAGISALQEIPQDYLWAWGKNDVGQLGLGDTVNRSSPVQVGALGTWSQVSGPHIGNFTHAVKTDGTLWAWGDQNVGQLGLGDAVSRSSPTQIGALTTWSKITAGVRISAAIKTDGTLWTWGYNASGALGLGDVINRSSPVQVGVLTTWSNVSLNTDGNASVDAIIATKTNGTMWSWGANDGAQLGVGNGSSDSINRSSPTQIGSLTTWTSATNGQYTSAAIKAPGTLWVCGRNNFGRLGLNSTSNTGGSLEQVGTATNWKQVSLGSYNSAALRG